MNHIATSPRSLKQIRFLRRKDGEMKNRKLILQLAFVLVPIVVDWIRKRNTRKNAGI